MDAAVLMDLQLDDNKPNVDVCMSDRFIPSRGTCGAVGQLKFKKDENWAPRNEYHEVLSQNVLGKESLSSTKVLSYKHKFRRQDPTQNELQLLHTYNRNDAARQKSKPSRVLPEKAMKVLDAPGLLDDFYSHPVEWSPKNVVSVALSETVFLFNAHSGHTEKLLTLPSGNATALRWTGEGVHLSVGTSSGEVQIWDACMQRQIRSLRGHTGRIGSLAWCEHILSSGSEDAEIHHHDVRVRDHLVCRLSGAHKDLVCGLDYSETGMLASGGNDNAVCIWKDTTATVPQHIFTEHTAAVKAIRWCPWQSHVLATGGGSTDRKVCLWNASSGRLLMSTETDSQVTDMVWGHQERELLTAHGYSRNQLSLWKYPSLIKVADLEGHSGRLIGLAQSPDGSMVCSSSADETLRFWQIFSPSSREKRNIDPSAPQSILRTIR